MSELSWFRGMAKRATAGDFSPALGLEVSKRRQSHTHTAATTDRLAASLSGRKVIEEMHGILKKKCN